MTTTYELLTFYSIASATYHSAKAIRWAFRQSLKTEHQIALYAHHKAGHKGHVSACEDCTTAETKPSHLQLA